MGIGPEISDQGSLTWAWLPSEWQDINFTTGTLQVLRVLTRVPTKMPERQHVYVEAKTKTKNSRRNVIIAPFALEALKEHRVRQLEAKLKAGASWQEHDYVFCTLHGTHLGPNHVVEEGRGPLHPPSFQGGVRRPRQGLHRD